MSTSNLLSAGSKRIVGQTSATDIVPWAWAWSRRTYDLFEVLPSGGVKVRVLAGELLLVEFSQGARGGCGCRRCVVEDSHPDPGLVKPLADGCTRSQRELVIGRGISCPKTGKVGQQESATQQVCEFHAIFTTGFQPTTCSKSRQKVSCRIDGEERCTESRHHGVLSVVIYQHQRCLHTLGTIDCGGCSGEDSMGPLCCDICKSRWWLQGVYER